MEIKGFPMDDYQEFPTHAEMLEYITNFAKDCGLRKYIKVSTYISSQK